jgi:hypothetical protein
MPHPEQPSYEEMAARNAELTARVAELLAVVAEQAALIETLRTEVAALRRQAGRDSLLTEQRPVFPQLERLAVVSGCTVTAHDRRAGAGPGGAGGAAGGRAAEDREPV